MKKKKLRIYDKYKNKITSRNVFIKRIMKPSPKKQNIQEGTL